MAGLLRRRQFEIKLKQKRKKKIARFLKLYSETKNKEEKEKILEKALKASLWVSEKEFLNRLQSKQEK